MRTPALIAALVFGCSAEPVPTCTPACAPGYACMDGACVPDGTRPDGGGGDATPGCTACGGLTPYCSPSHHCIGCLTDANCPTGSYCKVVDDTAASCVPGCLDDGRCAGGACCDGRCVDPMTSPDHCGGCGHPCGGPHAQAKCVGGACQAGACDPGWGDCDGDPGTGCETYLRVDAMNCTACGMACAIGHAVAGCADGCYLAACDFGWDDCNAMLGDGCETPVASDRNNCGGCGVACGNPPNAVGVCTAGTCGLGACNKGFTDCDGDVKNGCEANLLFDGKNCGACGNQCPMQEPACNGGMCTGAFAGLIAYWKFDGDVKDTVGNHHLMVPPQQQSPGFAAAKVGLGTNSPMGDPQNLWLSPMPNDINNNADFTLAFWARNNATSWYDSYAAWDSGGLIVYRHQQDNWRFLMFVQDANNQVQSLDSGVNLPKPPDPSWFFVVAQRTGNIVSLRINNGQPVTITVGNLKQGPALYVSRNSAGYSWPGQLDEMGYWNRSLTQGELDLLYNNGNGRTFP